MQTPQMISVDDFFSAYITFLRDHAADVDLLFHTAYLSIHDERFPDCAGQGRVWRVAIPYVEHSEPVPKDTGCVHVPAHFLDLSLTILGSTQEHVRHTVVSIDLTHQEQMSLMNVLVEHLDHHDKGAKKYFARDILDNHVMSVTDLLHVVSTAKTKP